MFSFVTYNNVKCKYVIVSSSPISRVCLWSMTSYRISKLQNRARHMQILEWKKYLPKEENTVASSLAAVKCSTLFQAEMNVFSHYEMVDSWYGID